MMTMIEKESQNGVPRDSARNGANGVRRVGPVRTSEERRRRRNNRWAGPTSQNNRRVGPTQSVSPVCNALPRERNRPHWTGMVMTSRYGGFGGIRDFSGCIGARRRGPSKSVTRERSAQAQQERLARSSGEQMVGLPGLDELLFARVHLEHDAEGGGSFFQIDIIGGEVLGHALEGREGVGVAFDLFANGVGGRLAAQAIGDVGGVAKGAGEMAFLNGGVEIAFVTAAHGFDE